VIIKVGKQLNGTWVKKYRDNRKLIKGNCTFVIRTKLALTQLEQGSSSPTVPMVTLAHQTKNVSFPERVTYAETFVGYKYNTAWIHLLFRWWTERFIKNIFPDSKIAEHYKMGGTKLSYVISHSLGPIFHRDLAQDIKQFERLVLCFD
jgi:hypothetical protein